METDNPHICSKFDILLLQIFTVPLCKILVAKVGHIFKRLRCEFSPPTHFGSTFLKKSDGHCVDSVITYWRYHILALSKFRRKSGQSENTTTTIAHCDYNSIATRLSKSLLHPPKLGRHFSTLYRPPSASRGRCSTPRLPVLNLS